jgi:hypothetical protein
VELMEKDVHVDPIMEVTAGVKNNMNINKDKLVRINLKCLQVRFVIKPLRSLKCLQARFAINIPKSPKHLEFLLS